MKLSVFYDHIVQAHKQSGKSITEIFKIVKSSGIDGIEINYSMLRKSPLLAYRIRKAGLSVSCIYETYNYGVSTDITKGRKHVDMAAKTGARRLLVIPGFLPKEEARQLNALSGSYEKTAEYMSSNAYICNMKEALTEITEYAASKNISVTLEDFDGSEAPFARINQLLWFMKNVPGLKYTLDMGNFAYSDEDVNEAFEVLGEYIVHVHCKDRGEDKSITAGLFNKGLIAVPTGGGYLPIGSLTERLKQRGYDGYLAIEHFDAPDQIGYIRQSAEFLNKFLAI